jgi:hypothetical protein
MHSITRIAAAVACVGVLGFGATACGSGENTANYETSVPTASYGPGSLSSTDLKMTEPAERGGKAIVTGTLLNAGEAGFITGAETNVAHKVKMFNGEQVVSEIPVASNGTQASQELTKEGYHLELEDVKMVVDNDGQITLKLITDEKNLSSVEVLVIRPGASPSASASISPSASATQ